MQSESALEWITGVHGVRTHASTDGVTELRVSFVANDIVNIDLAAEPPDPDLTGTSEDVDDEELEVRDQGDDTSSKKRGPYLYDPTKPEKLWIMEKYVKVGSPASFNAWEATLASKTSSTVAAATKTKASRKTKSKTTGRTMRTGALDSFTTVTKPILPTPSVCSNLQPQLRESGIAHVQNHAPVAPASPKTARATFAAPTFSFPKSTVSNPIEILSSSPPPNLPAREAASTLLDHEDPLASTITKRLRSPLERAQTDPVLVSEDDYWIDGHAQKQAHPAGRCVSPARSYSTDLPSPSRHFFSNQLRQESQSPKTAKSKATSKYSLRRTRQNTHDSLLSSPSRSNINFYFTQNKGMDEDMAAGSSRPALTQSFESVDLTMSSPAKPKKGSRPRAIQPEATSMPAKATATPRRRGLPSPEVSYSFTSSHLRSRSANSQTRGSGPCVARPTRGVQPAVLEADENFVVVLDLSEASPVKISTSQLDTSHTKISIEAPKEPTSPLPPPAKKQRIRVRKSLAGAFAIEEIDMSAVSAKKPMRVKAWRRSEVQILDLTEDI
jgi:holliday junction resolvase YEN1